MTNGPLSKVRPFFALIFLAIASFVVCNKPVQAQVAPPQPGDSIPPLEIRGPIDQNVQQETQVRPPNAFDQEPIVLGEDFTANDIDQPSVFPEDEVTGVNNFNEPDLNTAQGQREQLANDLTQANQRQTNVQRRAQAATPVLADPENDDTETRSNVRAEPVQTGTEVAPQDDPFEAQGFRMGIFDALLSVEQSVGVSSNVNQDFGGEAGAFSQTDVDASLTTDWSRHQWQTNVNGSFRKPFDDEAAEDTRFLLDSELRLDVMNDHTLSLSGNYLASTQQFTSTILDDDAIDTPLTESYGGQIEFERTNRKLLLLFGGSVQRTTFENADLGDDGILSQEDQDNVTYSLALRAGYELSPALIPFVEGVYSIRDFDLAVDRNGNRRDSDIIEISAGVQVDMGEKLTGEISAGFLNESFDDDPALDDLNAFIVNGEFVWSPQRDTAIRLLVSSQANNSISFNDNGSIIYNGRLSIDHQITDRLSVDAFADAQFETNIEEDINLQFGVGSQYWLNRHLALTADVEYFSFSSDPGDEDFDEVSGRVGVRWQR